MARWHGIGERLAGWAGGGSWPGRLGALAALALFYAATAAGNLSGTDDGFAFG